MPTILEFSEDRESPYAKNMFEFGVRINATDAAPILYESPYDDRYQLWLRKTKRMPPKEQTPEMLSGQVTEPLIFAWYQQHKGVTGLSQSWALHSDYDFIQAKCDFWAPQERLLAEFKAPTRPTTKDHEAAKSGTVPRHYFLQCQHLLEVFDVDVMDYVSWRSADDFAVLQVKRDQELWLTTMLPNYMDFWDCLVNDHPPRLEEKDQQDQQVSERRRMLGRQWLDVKEMHRECETREAKIKAELRRDQGDAKVIIGGGIKTLIVSVGGRWAVTIACN
jgi:putative phage-type endonuclease